MMSAPEPGDQPDRFRRLFASVPDAVMGMSSEGIITSWNPAAARILGYSAEQMIGRSAEVLAPPEKARELGDLLDRVARGETIRDHDTSQLTRDGRRVDVSVSLSPVRDAADRLVGAAMVVRDVTAEKRAVAERERLAKEHAAQVEAGRLKDEFLATLSHELRTPLNAILGWTQMLRHQRLDRATQAKALETIERNARAQARLIEDLLDLSQMLRDTLQVQPQPVDLGEIVGGAVEAAEPAAAAKAIRLEVQGPRSPLRVMGDARRLRQAVSNLLSNAVKFTPRGGRVRVEVERDDRSARVRLTDTGVGIPESFVPHVFDRLRQADSSTTRQHGGLGLGLAIVRSIVDAHGGTIEAFSAGLNKGASFTIHLPAPRGRRPRQVAAGDVAARAPAEASALGGLRVLVVDDTADERELFAAVLEQHGAEVETAAGVETALHLARSWRPDIIVTDLAMLGEDGYSLLGRIRAEPGPLQRLPVVAVTAHARAEDQARALEAGFTAYIAKPVEPARLVHTLAAAGREGPSPPPVRPRPRRHRPS